MLCITVVVQWCHSSDKFCTQENPNGMLFQERIIAGLEIQGCLQTIAKIVLFRCKTAEYSGPFHHSWWRQARPSRTWTVCKRNGWTLTTWAPLCPRFACRMSRALSCWERCNSSKTFVNCNSSKVCFANLKAGLIQSLSVNLLIPFRKSGWHV